MTRTAGWLQEATDRGGILQSFPFHTMFNGYNETHIKYGVRDLKDPEKNVSSAFLQISPSAHKGIHFCPYHFFRQREVLMRTLIVFFPILDLFVPKEEKTLLQLFTR